MPGEVYIVGAGPGDPELISVKGLRALRQCDAVVYDALVSGELVDSAPPSAERIFAGKRAGMHCMGQEEINDIVVAKAREGKTVVRLKGGDPCIFGRGGEEIAALRRAGIQPRIIPGITSGTGIPTSLGIPLTYRGISSNVVFVTGHGCGESERQPDWHAIAAIDTIVVYMGLKAIGSIVRTLIKHGRDGQTPVSVIFGGTYMDERILSGTLDTIAGAAGDVRTAHPALIVIGEVTKLGSLPNKNGGYGNHGVSGEALDSLLELADSLQAESSI